MKKIFIFFTSLVIVLGFVGYSYVFGGCVNDIDFAKSRVMEHLAKNELPSEELEYDPANTSECVVAFTYQNKGNTIHFSVIDGGKVTWWDVSKRGPLNGS